MANDGNQDKKEGLLDKAKGKVKEAVGDATNNDQKKAEGQVQKEKGDVQERTGDIKRDREGDRH